MKINQLPITVIEVFMRGESCSIGPFSTNGQYLYLNDQPIAYRNQHGDIMKVALNHPILEPFTPWYKTPFFQSLAITLPCIGLFFYVLFAQFGGY
jgi:hypothetical protein